MQAIKKIMDQSKSITDIASDLRNVDVEIAENPNCYALKSLRVRLLTDMQDRVRSALIIATSEVRRERATCTDCIRCEEHMKYV
jgi:hypothetical protein